MAGWFYGQSVVIFAPPAAGRRPVEKNLWMYPRGEVRRNDRFAFPLLASLPVANLVFTLQLPICRCPGLHASGRR
jgi:hypothetical protein